VRAYIVAVLDVREPERFDEYRRQVPATIERYGGRYLIRGGAYEKLEGAWEPRRLTVVEFDSVEAARRWYESDEYRPLRELRSECAGSDLLLVEGIDAPSPRPRPDE
jgi:uncharacterized protein (DUF1330 family)